MILSGTLDQLGGFAATVAEVAELCSVMAAADLSPAREPERPRFRVYRSPQSAEMELGPLR